MDYGIELCTQGWYLAEFLWGQCGLGLFRIQSINDAISGQPGVWEQQQSRSNAGICGCEYGQY